MFWIVGATTVARALDQMGDAPIFTILSDQLRHPTWHGFTFYDLIFPLFIFIVGVSVVFSLSRTIEKEGREVALRRLFRRSLLLYFFGLVYSGLFSIPLAEFRWLGVLQRIALCYFFTGLLFCYFKPKVLAGICASLIVGYWAVMTFIPVPGYGFASYGQYVSLANYLDDLILPGQNWIDSHNPEGLLSTIPAVGTCLLGVFAGFLLKDRPTVSWLRHFDGFGRNREGIILLAGGVVLLVIGYLWSFQFPINKRIWTSSYVLVTGGLSAMLLGLFHLVIDVWDRRAWCIPFVWFGMNAITIYMADRLVDFQAIAYRFAGGDIREFLNTSVAQGLGDLLLALITLGLSFLVCWFLYHKRIFLKV